MPQPTLISLTVISPFTFKQTLLPCYKPLRPKSYSTTGRGSYKLFTSATCVFLPTRPSSASNLPLFWLDLERWFSLRQSNRLNTLATYPVPNVFDQLISFIGAYKVLSSVISRCSSYLAPLDAVTSGRPTWIQSMISGLHSVGLRTLFHLRSQSRSQNLRTSYGL